MRTLADLLPTLKSTDRVLLRADLNVPLREEAGEIVVSDDNRIRAMLPTLDRVLATGASIVLCSHLGRPKGVDETLSLAPIARDLVARGYSKLRLIPGAPTDSAVLEAARALEPGHVLLLENLRFDPREKANDPAFAGALAGLATHFVNDAFGCCHRAHASIAGVTEHLTGFAGDLIRREVEVLTEIRDRPKRPFWVILGGAKVADKLPVVRQLKERVDGFLVGGGMANTFLAGLDVPVGDSRVEAEWLDELRSLVEDPDGSVEWVFPEDFVAGDAPFNPSETTVVDRGDTPPDGFSFFDIGPKTIETFVQRLLGAATVFWNGPLGVFEDAAFETGTRTISSELADLGSQRIIGGGDTAAAVLHFGDGPRMTHVSTGGGASLEFLEGKELPGLTVLS